MYIHVHTYTGLYVPLGLHLSHTLALRLGRSSQCPCQVHMSCMILGIYLIFSWFHVNMSSCTRIVHFQATSAVFTIFAANNLQYLKNYTFSGYLCSTFGWQWVFYVFGAIGVVW